MGHSEGIFKKKSKIQDRTERHADRHLIHPIPYGQMEKCGVESENGRK